MDQTESPEYPQIFYLTLSECEKVMKALKALKAGKDALEAQNENLKVKRETSQRIAETVDQQSSKNETPHMEEMNAAPGCKTCTKDPREDGSSVSTLPVITAPCSSGFIDGQKTLDKSSLVQITASKEELQRRISAFINHKRNEIDELNKGEFGCPDSDNSCARVNAVYVPKFGKSRLKVTRVFNTHGPQTHMTNTGQSTVFSGGDRDSWMRAWEESLEERLGNVEHHLKLNRDSAHDYLGRIKAVEERVLFLEGLSTEYFQGGPPQPKRRKPANAVYMAGNGSEIPARIKEKYHNWTLADIDQRIHELRSLVQQKSRKEI